MMVYVIHFVLFFPLYQILFIHVHDHKWIIQLFLDLEVVINLSKTILLLLDPHKVVVNLSGVHKQIGYLSHTLVIVLQQLDPLEVVMNLVFKILVLLSYILFYF